MNLFCNDPFAVLLFGEIACHRCVVVGTRLRCSNPVLFWRMTFLHLPHSHRFAFLVFAFIPAFALWLDVPKVCDN